MSKNTVDGNCMTKMLIVMLVFDRVRTCDLRDLIELFTLRLAH